MEKLIELNSDNILEEHIYCAFSDKKCNESYELKKEWLKKEFDHGYVFRRIDARAKVFIEYGPAEKVMSGACPDNEGIVVYFSNRCPYAEFHAKTSLIESATKRHLPYKLIKLETMEQAQSSPSPGTIFSLFYNGKFITTDISICMDSRFDNLIEKALKWSHATVLKRKSNTVDTMCGK